MKYIVSTRPYTYCDCRVVECKDMDPHEEAIHEAVGIERGAETPWYLEWCEDDEPYEGCAKRCTLEGFPTAHIGGSYD